MGPKFFHRLQIERCAGERYSPPRTVFGQRRQMVQRQLPFLARAVLGRCGQDLGREHPVDLEQLEFHRVAARIGGRIDEGESAGEVAAMIAGGFGNEERPPHGENPLFVLNAF